MNNRIKTPVYVPARIIKNRYGKNTGYFASKKMGRMIQYESLLERDIIYILEYDKNISKYFEQPVEIKCMYFGVIRKHYPDFKCVFADGHTELWEAKPYNKLEDPDVKKNIYLGESYCQQRGWIYKVITDKQIYSNSLVDNIQFLTYYRKQPECSDEIIRQIVQSVVLEEFTTISKILKFLVNVKSEILLQCVYYLIYTQVLHVDLTQALNFESVIALSKNFRR